MDATTWDETFEPSAPDSRLVAHVWWCEDDCDCSEARIDEVWQDPADRRWMKRRTVWRGRYRIEGEPGAHADLNREARRLRKENREMRRRISWPWSPGRK